LTGVHPGGTTGSVTAIDVVNPVKLAGAYRDLLLRLQGRGSAAPPLAREVKHGRHYRSHYVAAARPLVEPALMYKGPERRKRDRRSANRSPGAGERRLLPDRRRRPVGPS
jgi:hypothetical protein